MPFLADNMDGQLPKTIYYCWFGHGKLSNTALNCLESWKEHAPGFQIIRCDEEMFDVQSHPWTKAAYAASKYAYVSDYVRFWLIYNNGGVYMDLGSELVRDIGQLCEDLSPFTAIEECSQTATPGLIMSAPCHNSLIAEVLDVYDSLSFSDEPDFLEAHTVNKIFTSCLESRGFTREDIFQKVGEWTVLPSMAFNPVFGLGGYHIKKDTYSVHHYSGSWVEPKFQMKRKLVQSLSPYVGRRIAQVIGRIVAEVKYEGVYSGLKNLVNVAKCAIQRKIVK